jgi:O-6-methylguanine DNA methyltransferase
MARWALIKSYLTDGLPIRMYAAEDEGRLWRTSICDDEYPLDEDEFVRQLGSQRDWKCSNDGENSGTLNAAAVQLVEYCTGRRLEFDLPFCLRGTLFQVRVWEELLRIPFGATRSYRDMAALIHHPSAFRAVGAANGQNHLPLVVPCHRVIASNGTLAGFGAGIGLKKRLLGHEMSVTGFHPAQQTFLALDA